MKNDWFTCNGEGAQGKHTAHARPARMELSAPISRRRVLLGGALAAVGWAASGATALADVAVTPDAN